jgi:alginate O-acetyltransferase complex protein AlgI
MAYSIQILFDFWGYTDMAMGIGKMLGIELPQNFNLPYTAQSITEFWTRWHISLSTWLRDYLYISLGGNRKGNLRTYVNLMITMLLGGLWHGASWNFVLWGGLHGVYLAAERFFFGGGKPAQYPWTSPLAWLRSFFVFGLVSITWVPFRSPNWETTTLIMKKLLFAQTGYNIEWLYVWAWITIPIIVGGWLARQFKWRWPILSIQKSYTPAVIVFQALIVFFFSPLSTSPFIYFQF